MTLKQNILRLAYPLFSGWKRIRGKNENLTNPGQLPPVSFYSLFVQLNSGEELHFERLKGKKVLLVNTASDCGYTSQYAELQQLYRVHKDHLEIIAFPANDFKQQEKGKDEEIARFCRENYGITFPVARKSIVVQAPGQNKVFRWLSSPELNGWNSKGPVWNFSKYRVNEAGVLTHYFDPSISPLSREVAGAIQ